MSPKAPADAVREAPTERVLALLAKHGGWQATLDHIADLEARLAALAGAAPVAWQYRYTYADGSTIGWQDCDKEFAERFSNEPRHKFRPLFTHAPAKAREVTEADVRRACAEYESEHWLDSYEAMRAALATFAEGAE